MVKQQNTNCAMQFRRQNPDLQTSGRDNGRGALSACRTARSRDGTPELEQGIVFLVVLIPRIRAALLGPKVQATDRLQTTSRRGG